MKLNPHKLIQINVIRVRAAKKNGWLHTKFAQNNSICTHLVLSCYSFFYFSGSQSAKYQQNTKTSFLQLQLASVNNLQLLNFNWRRWANSEIHLLNLARKTTSRSTFNQKIKNCLMYAPGGKNCWIRVNSRLCLCLMLLAECLFIYSSVEPENKKQYSTTLPEAGEK